MIIVLGLDQKSTNQILDSDVSSTTTKLSFMTEKPDEDYPRNIWSTHENDMIVFY